MFALIQGRQLHYDVFGSGDPILLVHGWGGSMESLRLLGKILAITNTVILVDLPGFGRSENPDPTWGVSEYAQVLVDLVAMLKLRNLAYFGHSFGGSLGIYLTAQKQLKITQLYLCNSSYKRTGKRSILARLFHHILPKNNPPLRRLLYQIFFRSSDIARYPHLEQNLRVIVKQDLTDLPEKITIPTHIIWGAGDTITPVAWAQELHEKIARSTLSIIPNTRHGLPLRNPEVVAEEIQKYL